MAIAILCAVVGAWFSAIGAALQHAGVQAETRDAELTLRGLPRLVRNRRWLLGFGVLFVSAVLLIVALALAPVTVVAPIAVLSLPIIAVIDARRERRRLTPSFVAAVAACTIGVTAFVTIAAGTAVKTDVPGKVMLQASQLVAAVVCVFVVIGTFQGGALRSLAFAAGAGAAYGLVSVLVRDVAISLNDLPWASLAGLAASFLVGAWLIQLAYSSGPPDLVVACQTVVNPIVAAWIGMVLLDETATAGLWTKAALVLCGVASIAGIAALARYHREAVVSSGEPS